MESLQAITALTRTWMSWVFMAPDQMEIHRINFKDGKSYHGGWYTDFWFDLNRGWLKMQCLDTEVTEWEDWLAKDLGTYNINN
jgi:hypothetical protein